jgi:sarcosine reductase
MHLEIRKFPVRKIRFADQTRLEDGVLEIDPRAVTDLVMQDPRLAAVELDIAEPGESTRVVHVNDAIEPRLKVEGPGKCYPGVGGSVVSVGKGVTHRLSGMAVVLSAEYPRQIQSGVGAAYEAILDMSGPGALSQLSRTINLVLSLKLHSGHSVADNHQAVQMAGHKVSEYLAKTTIGKTPAENKEYCLTRPESVLPKVVYIHQMLTQLNLPIPHIAWYGSYVTDWMPLWVHPNEILDGALLPCAFGGNAVKPTSWENVNNPVIERLYKAHGKDIDFAGVILHRTRFETFEEKELSANQAANLAKLIGAQGAIITWIGAGNAFIEGMLTAQALEREGVKAVFMTYEHGGKEGREAPLIFSTPEADALVSIGSLDRLITLPPVERVIGGPDLSVSPEAGTSRIPSNGEIKLDWYLPVAGSVDHWGFGNQTCIDY